MNCAALVTQREAYPDIKAARAAVEKELARITEDKRALAALAGGPSLAESFETRKPVGKAKAKQKQKPHPPEVLPESGRS